mmetsp:Transcript_51853/g.133950  ORF Transcript_51853/g.133950 Transcript_51853/m.133950 type:complete len:218 (-) Transcript_51853:347-1000(-)
MFAGRDASASGAAAAATAGGALLGGGFPRYKLSEMPPSLKPCMAWKAWAAEASEANSTTKVPLCTSVAEASGMTSTLVIIPKVWKIVWIEACCVSWGMLLTATLRRSAADMTAAGSEDTPPPEGIVCAICGITPGEAVCRFWAVGWPTRIRRPFRKKSCKTWMALSAEPCWAYSTKAKPFVTGGLPSFGMSMPVTMPKGLKICMISCSVTMVSKFPT